MLEWTIYLSFIGAALIALLPARWAGMARWLALGTTTGAFLLGCAAASEFPRSGEIQILRDIAWVPQLGLRYLLAADGVSVVMVLLTGIASFAGVLFSWNVRNRVRGFFLFYLVLIAGVYGVFLSFDLFLLFVFYELAIIPKYFLIAIWGSTNREYGAMKLALYSFVGSALVLVGILAIYATAGAQTMSLIHLGEIQFSEPFQKWVFPMVFIGFAILAGLWPFHTWAPTGHVAAPTAASMLLAGVVMKLGAYGAMRVALTLLPNGLDAWRHEFALLAVVGIVFGATVAMVQRDFKFVIGYSSVSHMGFVLLGLMTLNEAGMSGAVLQMFSHGIIAGLLFGVVGRMVYDRAHTRELPVLEGMELGRALPFAGVTFLVASMASMGLPGFSGFVAELLVLIGAWKAFPGFAIAAGAGIVLGAAYTLRVLQKAFYGEAEGVKGEPLSPITVPEKLGAIVLLGTTLAVGLYPRMLLDLIAPAVEANWLSGWRAAGLL